MHSVDGYEAALAKGNGLIVRGMSESAKTHQLVHCLWRRITSNLEGASALQKVRCISKEHYLRSKSSPCLWQLQASQPGQSWVCLWPWKTLIAALNVMVVKENDGTIVRTSWPRHYLSAVGGENLSVLLAPRNGPPCRADHIHADTLDLPCLTLDFYDACPSIVTVVALVLSTSSIVMPPSTRRQVRIAPVLL
jgi:hypothetical protein